MPDRTSVSRTLVKSPPELWAEISDPEALGRHLEPFGEIRITRAEPEHTVAWEGESVSGTVELEPAGWGTKVTLGAIPSSADTPTVEISAVEEAPVPEPAPAPVPAPRGLLTRLAFWRRPAEPVPDPVPEPQPEPAPVAPAGQPPGPEVEPVLTSTLDALGAATKRPFSRG